VGAVVTIEDITLKRRLEADARRRVEFEQQLVGIVSHDLRNPLNVITLSATTLLRRPGLDEQQTRLLTRLLGSAERANRLIRDLLDFTRARLGGGIPIASKSIELHGLVRQVVDEAAVSHPGRRILVEARGDGQGEWDPDRLAQVVMNLVNNALTYGPAEAPVRVSSLGEEGWVELAVHNEGPPIPEELRPHLFEPLRRGVDEAGAATRSIGLGLYIVRTLVQAHGGTVSVDSRSEVGTTFTVRLPRRLVQQATLPGDVQGG
jgi:signal transduction histidine kinase